MKQLPYFHHTSTATDHTYLRFVCRLHYGSCGYTHSAIVTARKWFIDRLIPHDISRKSERRADQQFSFWRNALGNWNVFAVFSNLTTFAPCEFQWICSYLQAPHRNNLETLNYVIVWNLSAIQWHLNFNRTSWNSQFLRVCSWKKMSAFKVMELGTEQTSWQKLKTFSFKTTE